MMILFGTLPYKDFPLTYGQVSREGDKLKADGREFSRTQGTGAMISAALAMATHFKEDPPYVLVAGDIGEGNGTREIYQYLTQRVGELAPDYIAMHYSLPIMTLMRKFIETVKGCSKKPFLIADAGAMYAAKGAGLAGEFDIFTPDPSEMAFLADPQATHPAYIAKHLFDIDASLVPQQIADAFRQGSAAKLLLVKGKTDYVAQNGEVLHMINEPNVPHLEPIGGTGDTITGLVSGLVYCGLAPKDAAVFACRTNRTAGMLAEPNPATKVTEIIDQFPQVAKDYFCSWSGVCYTDDK